MFRKSFTTLIIAILVLQHFASSALFAQKSNSDKRAKVAKADQFVRDVAKLEGVHTIAIVPVVIQLHFDNKRKLPAPHDMQVQVVSAAQTPALFVQAGSETRFKFISGEVITNALTALNYLPTDLYQTKKRASWEMPAETFTGKKHDEIALLAKRTEIKEAPEEMSLFRYRSQEITDSVLGLAASKTGVFSHLDTERMSALRTKLGVDALLLVQVTDMFDRRGYSDSAMIFGGLIFGQRKESTGLQLQATLVGSTDNSILWQARARGLKTRTTGILHAGNINSEVDKQANICTENAILSLLNDLSEGTGNPIKPSR